MIKWLHFVGRSAGVSTQVFAAGWEERVSALSAAPEGARPVRLTASIVLRDLPGTSASHDGIAMAWFEDVGGAKAFARWLASREPRGPGGTARPMAIGAECTLMAEEVVLRGAPWLAQRWSQQGGLVPRFKHMALAKRASGLSLHEFSERWRHKQGQVAGKTPAVMLAIPEAAKGLAYIQNHPLPGSEVPGSQACDYDAVNEVYFDDLAGMRARIDFFERNAVGRSEDDLVREAKFIAVQERVIG